MRLTEVARLESGHTPSRKHPEYWDGDVPWVSLPDARKHHGSVIFNTLQNTNEKGIANSSARLLPIDTVCLSRTASVGYVFRLGRPMATSQDFVNWVCSDALDPRFLMFALMAEGEHILEFGKGSTHTTIYFPEVLAFHLCLPPLAEQRRIVKKVEALLARVDDVRGRLKRVRALTKGLRKRIIGAACSGSLTEDWRQAADAGDTATELLARLALKTEDLNGRRRRTFIAPAVPRDDFDLPSAWAWATCSQVSRLDVGFAFKSADFKPDGIRLLRGENIEPGKLRWVDTQYWPADRAGEFRELFVEEGEIILALDRPLISSGLKIARAMRADLPAILVQRVMRFKAADPQVSAFLYLALQTTQFVDSLHHGGLTGSDLPHITGNAVAEFTFPFPPLDEQRVIVQRVDSLTRLLDTIERRVSATLLRADKLQQAILAKAFAGELVPAEAEVARREHRDYEPASALLERVARQGSGATKPFRTKRT